MSMYAENLAEQEHETSQVPTVGSYQIDLSRMLYMQYMEIDWSIRQADMKAQVVFGVNAVLLTVLTGQALGDLGTLFDTGMQISTRLFLLLNLLVLILLVMSIFLSTLAVIPRFRPSEEGNNLFFFGDIVQQSEADYIEMYESMSLHEVKRTVLAQIHTKSFIVRAKFRKVQWSMIFLVLAVVLWGIRYILPV